MEEIILPEPLEDNEIAIIDRPDFKAREKERQDAKRRWRMFVIFVVVAVLVKFLLEV